jgi:hypothetical protein
MQHKYESLIRYGLIPLTILLATLYLSRGYRNALLLPEGSYDLWIRYQEQHYIIKGVNPNYIYEVLRGYSGAKAVEIDPTNDPPPSIAGLGLHWQGGLLPGGGGYPPWAYFTALFLVPTFNWPVTKLFFAILNTFSLGIMAWFTYWITRPYGRLPAFGLLTSVLAMGSNSFTLGAGQYGLVVNAMIAGMALCLTAERPVGAGMLYGLSLVKPSISAPFFFVLMDRQRKSAIMVTVVYIATASLAIWAITGTDPMTMLIQMLDCRRAGGLTGMGDRGAVAIALLLGISEQIVLTVTAITGLVVSFLVMRAFRQSHLIILLGTASVLGHLWTVHRVHDDVMMAFLLIASGHLALRESSLPNNIVFALVAISLWLPPSVSAITYIGYSQLLIWIFSLVYLLVRERHEALRRRVAGREQSRPAP